jgi:putative hydrolase of the HAD superfamily
MIPPNVKAIFFDAVGTLIHPDPPAIEVYADVGRRLGSQLSVEAIQKLFHASFKDQDRIDRANNFITNESREAERWRSIVAASLPDVFDLDRAFSELFSHFAQPSSWRWEMDAPPVLQDLAERGYLLGMASNFDSRLREAVRGIPELSLLKHVVISSEVGWRKPSRMFFDAICRMVDLSGVQILYVGDDRVNDYEGARMAGLKSILFASPDDSSHDNSGIKRLGDLLESKS